MGSWVDLEVEEPTTRLESSESERRDTRRVDQAVHTPVPVDEDLGPVGAAITRMIHLIKGDAYYMFLAVAILLIIFLGIALLAFRPSA